MISEPRFWDGPSRDFGPNKILSTNLVERSSMPKQDFYLFNIIAWYGNCLMNMVLFYKMTFSYMILFKHKFLKNFYPIFIMKGEHQAKLSWWIELIICQHSNILCSRFYLNQITHNCKFLFTIFLGRTFVPFLPTYQPKHQRTLLCNKKCIQELADASSRTPLHPAAAMIEHQTHVQLTSLTNT